MDLRIVFLVLIAIINLFLGGFVFLKNPRSSTNIFYSLTISAVFLWTIGLTAFFLTTSPFWALFWAKFYYAAAAFIPAAFFAFSHIFPAQKFKLSIFKIFLIVFPPILVIAPLFIPGFHIKEIIFESWGKNVILGPAYYLYSLYFVVFMAWAFFILLAKHSQSSGILRVQLRYVLAGTFAASVFGMTFNLFLPLLGNYRLIWLGPYCTLIMVVCIAYAIARHHLMNVRVIATELFVAAIILLFLVNTILSQSSGEFLIQAAFLFLVIVFGFLLIKGTLREIETITRLSQAKSEFISIVSHQLRTPLTAIKGYISIILEKKGISPQIKSYLEKTYKSNERLIGLINDILDISKIEMDKIEMHLERVSLEDLISSVVDELKNEAAKKNILLKQEKLSRPLSEIQVDRNKMRQVILNLVDNAIRYTNNGSVLIKIKAQESKLKIIITDTGEGMSKEEIIHLFESFSRGKAGAKLWTEGTGLGLYVAKKFVEMHNGKIWAESKGKGKGSTFYVELFIK